MPMLEVANGAGGKDNGPAVIVKPMKFRKKEAPEPAIPDHDTSEIPPLKPRRRRGRSFLRVLAWVLPILVVLAIAFLAVGWYARNTYYVGVNRGRVTLFQGVKGGLLVWNPTIERHTTINPGDLTGAQRQDVKDGKKFSSSSGANAYVARLRQGIADRTPARPTTTH